jgi:hypothetical protein
MTKRRLGKTAKKEITLMDGLARAITRPELEDIVLAQVGSQESRQKFEMFIAMMHDPAFATHKLATMARECGISYTELTDMIKKHSVAEGLVKMARHAPQVMEDVAKESMSTTKVCEKCDGDGTLLKDVKVEVEGEEMKVQKVPQPCRHCDGTGKVTKAGSAAARKIFFEAIGVTGKTPMVAIQNNTLNVGDEDGMEGILRLGRERQLERPTIQGEEIKEAGE